MQRIALLSFASVISLLTACGGGGGGGSDGGGTITPAPTPEVPAAADGYQGLQTSAALTQGNAAAFLAAISASPQAGELLPDFSSMNRGVAFQAFGTQTLRSVSRHAVADHPLGPQARESIDEALLCDSGSGTLHGELDDDSGTGRLTQTFSRCVIQGVELDGSVAIDFLRWDMNYLVPLDMDIYYDQFSSALLYDDESQVTHGEVKIRNAGECDESFNFNIVWDYPGAGDDTYYQDVQQVTRCSDWGKQIDGRIFKGGIGYVDIETLSPLLFDLNYLQGSSAFIYDGSLRFHNEHGSVHVSTHVADGYGNVDVQIDIASHGESEQTFRFPAWYMSSNELQDLADDDQDGMFDGWERYHGLSPEYDDAAEDLDGDGFSNYVEFISRTDPSNPGYADQPHIYFVLYTNYLGQVSGPMIDLSLGIPAEFTLGVNGNIDAALASHLQDYRLTVSLPPLGEWSFQGPDSCRLEADNLTTLVCEQQPLAAFVGEEWDETVLLDHIRLTLLPTTTGGGVINASIEVSPEHWFAAEPVEFNVTE